MLGLFRVKAFVEVKLDRAEDSGDLACDVILEARHELRVLLSFCLLTLLSGFLVVLLCDLLLNLLLCLCTLLVALSRPFCIAFLSLWSSLLSSLLSFFFKISL